MSDINRHATTDAELVNMFEQLPIDQAVAYFNGMWPCYLDSGVLFFNGYRVMKDEFNKRAAILNAK